MMQEMEAGKKEVAAARESATQMAQEMEAGKAAARESAARMAKEMAASAARTELMAQEMAAMRAELTGLKVHTIHTDFTKKRYGHKSLLRSVCSVHLFKCPLCRVSSWHRNRSQLSPLFRPL